MNETRLLVDTNGEQVLANSPSREPECASVVLTEGEHGTAWQRHFADGLWYRLGGGKPVSWGVLITTKRNVVLVYDAEPRMSGVSGNQKVGA